MILAKEENIVKEWCYAVSSKETKHTLTVTNKRVISESKNNNKTIREELPINLIKGISCSTEKLSKFISLLFFTLGIILIVFNFILIFSIIEINVFFDVLLSTLFLSALPISLTILFFLIGIDKRNKRNSCPTKNISKFTPFIFFISGIICIIFNILIIFKILPQLKGNYYLDTILTILFISIFPITVSILSFLIGFNKRKRGSFLLTFHTHERANGSYLHLNSSNLITPKSPIFKLFFYKKIFVKVNNEICQDIIDTIGAIIIDCQNGNINQYNDNNSN